MEGAGGDGEDCMVTHSHASWQPGSPLAIDVLAADRDAPLFAVLPHVGVLHSWKSPSAVDCAGRRADGLKDHV